jgi:hypothetical protein
MILTLTAGGVSTVTATAAVLLYRLISFALVVALGWLAWGATGVAERRHTSQSTQQVAALSAETPAYQPAAAA